MRRCTVSIFGTERGTVRGVVRAAAGAYDRESCCMDSIVRTCDAEVGAVGAQWKQFLRCLPLRLGRCCVHVAMRVHGVAARYHAAPQWAMAYSEGEEG